MILKTVIIFGLLAIISIVIIVLGVVLFIRLKNRKDNSVTIEDEDGNQVTYTIKYNRIK